MKVKVLSDGAVRYVQGTTETKANSIMLLFHRVFINFFYAEKQLPEQKVIVKNSSDYCSRKTIERCQDG